MAALARKHPLFLVVLWTALAVLALAAGRHLGAHAAAPVPALPRAAVSGGQTLHVASADLDVGPGDAEPALAQHPVR